MIQFLRCGVHYGKYLDGLSKEPVELPKITLREDKEKLELTEEEEEGYEIRAKGELVPLGIIGTFASAAEGKGFKSKVDDIKKIAIETTQSAYQGDDAKWLVGNDKIPEFLSKYLEKANKEAENFRINCVRYLRTTCIDLVNLCEKIPESIFSYITLTFTNKIESIISKEEQEYLTFESISFEEKEKNKVLLKFTLSDPANEDAMAKLNKEESERAEKFQDKLDDIQLALVDCELDNSQAYYLYFLNNMKALVTLFDCLLYKENFIELPGESFRAKTTLTRDSKRNPLSFDKC